MSDRFLIARTENAGDLPLPQYMTKGAAGMDLYANVAGYEILLPSEIKKIPVGIILALPNGYEAQIRPRSGLALRGVTMVNAPGTVDADYRGEISVILINLGSDSFTIERGMRIAQMVIAKAERVEFTEETPERLGETERGAGGFGHTGE